MFNVQTWERKQIANSGVRYNTTGILDSRHHSTLSSALVTSSLQSCALQLGAASPAILINYCLYSNCAVCGNIVIQAIFHALQLFTWGFALTQCLRIRNSLVLECRLELKRSLADI